MAATAAVGCGDDRFAPNPPPILHGDEAEVEARLEPLVERIARRVERLRDLEFREVPTLVLMNHHELAVLGRQLANRAERRLALAHAQVRRQRRLLRAGVGFDELAGLLPRGFSFGPDASRSLDRIGGAYDYRDNRILLVRGLIATRQQLVYTIAHELVHSLESQNFDIRFDSLIAPGERTSVYGSVIEGTATYLQDRYRRAYLNDEVPVRQRLEGSRSVIAAGNGPYAINAKAVFDYVDGALFVDSLYRRAGGWRLVNQALRDPPRSSRQILHPATWPRSRPPAPIDLGVEGLLRPGRRLVGGGTAGEEQALVILLAGRNPVSALAGASGWDGGRFELWAPRGSAGAVEDDVGVVAFRWRRPSDVEQFTLTVPYYVISGLLARRIDEGLWQPREGGYIALGSTARASALAFAPDADLARAVAQRAAATAGER